VKPDITQDDRRSDMPERDYDRDRSREFEDRGYDRGWTDRPRGREERGMLPRGADEVRSWFGDEEARRRREMDDRREREERYRNERNWSGEFERGYGSSREWGGEALPSAPPSRWQESRYEPGAHWGSSTGYAGGAWTGTGYAPPVTRDVVEGWRGGTFAGRGPRSYQRSDERIREDVNDRLTEDPRVDATDIEVQVQNGEVTLSGRVSDRRMRRMAEESIDNISGVRDVRNDLRVSYAEQSPNLAGNQTQSEPVRKNK
jgi:BON domain-containing protein